LTYGHTRRKALAQSLVEFALIGPLFFLMLFGTIEMGRAVYTNHQLANGVREGTRYAAVHGSKATSQATSDTVKTQMLTKMTAISSGKLSVTLSYPDGNNDPGSKAKVTAVYTFTPVVSLVFGTGSITMTQSSTVIIKH
jgi:Flp pilus assembly protein TadG